MLSQVHFMSTYIEEKMKKYLYLKTCVLVFDCPTNYNSEMNVCERVTLQAWCDAGIYCCPDYLQILKWHINTMTDMLIGHKHTSLTSHWPDTSLLRSLLADIKPVVWPQSLGKVTLSFGVLFLLVFYDIKVLYLILLL